MRSAAYMSDGGTSNASTPAQQVMNTRGYDRNKFTKRELRQKLDYCHKNPLPLRGQDAARLRPSGA
jgi:hypothetical protein